MPRNASLSSHGPRGCTFRVSRAALLRLRLKSRQFRADSGRSCRVKENNNLHLCLGAAEKSAALFACFNISIDEPVALNLRNAKNSQDHPHATSKRTQVFPLWQRVELHFRHRKVFAVIREQCTTTLDRNSSHYRIRKSQRVALPRPGVFQPACKPRARSGELVQLQSAEQRFRPAFLGGPHAGIDLCDVERRSREDMPGSHQFGKPFVALVPEAKDVNQDRRVQQQLHFFARRCFFVRFLSPSCRNSRTHAAAPSASSGWSASFQAAVSLSRKRSSFFRRTASRAVSTRKALRPLGPTIESISFTRSWGSRIWARLLFIYAHSLCACPVYHTYVCIAACLCLLSRVAIRKFPLL